MSTENVIETENKASENQSPKMSDFVKTNAEGKKVFDLVKFKQYITTSLSYQNFYNRFNRSYLRYTRCEIEQMAEHPEMYGKRIVSLSQFMYLKSGYYKRLIDYFTNQAKLNYTIDTRTLKPGMISNNKPDTIKKNYIAFATQAEKFGLQNEIHNILKRLYREDACFAYVLENESGISYYYFDPMICHISSLTDGKVYQFSIDIPLAGRFGYIDLFPAEYNDKDYLYFINDDGTEEKYNLSMEERLSLAQFELLKTEVVTMCKYESQGNITYNYPPDKRNILHDDRVFSLGLMCFYLAQLRHGEVYQKKKSDIKLDVSALCRRPSIA